MRSNTRLKHLEDRQPTFTEMTRIADLALSPEFLRMLEAVDEGGGTEVEVAEAERYWTDKNHPQWGRVFRAMDARWPRRKWHTVWMNYHATHNGCAGFEEWMALRLYADDNGLREDGERTPLDVLPSFRARPEQERQQYHAQANAKIDRYYRQYENRK